MAQSEIKEWAKANKLQQWVDMMEDLDCDELVAMIERDNPKWAADWKRDEENGYHDGFGGMECRHEYVRHVIGD